MTTDPIYAAIKEHRQSISPSYVDWQAAADRKLRFEEELPVQSLDLRLNAAERGRRWHDIECETVDLWQSIAIALPGDCDNVQCLQSPQPAKNHRSDQSARTRPTATRAWAACDEVSSMTQ